MKLQQFFIIVFLISISLPTFVLSAATKDKIIFGGGATGETLHSFANAIQTFKPVKDSQNFKLQVQSSEGSVENLKKIDDGTFQMGIVYAGDLWRGVNGKITAYQQTNSPAPVYNKVMAISSLYTSSAQFVIRADLGIKSVKELEGKKVGVGNIGSADYSTCELFFSHIGMWDKIEKKKIGYNDAARAFKNKEVDAFWVFSALPSSAVNFAVEQARDDKSLVEIINLGEDAEQSGFIREFPWFSLTAIKGGTYKGFEQKIVSFQDVAIWVAGADLSVDVVYEMLSIIYSDEGLKYLSEQNVSLRDISIQTGITGIITKLHPGAEKFWKEKGVIVEKTIKVTPDSPAKSE